MDSLSHGFWLELAKPAARVLLAVGLGAQTLVKDLISGLFLLLENQVRVGDVVSVGDKGGLVESMGLRVLTLRDASGNVHIIPNGSVDRVTNMTRDYSRYVFDIGIAYREDPDEAMRVIQDVGDALEKDVEFAADILEPLEMLGIERFTDSAVIIRCRIKTRPIKQWRIAREFNRRLKKAFDARDTIYFGLPKEGPARRSASPSTAPRGEREPMRSMIHDDAPAVRSGRRGSE